MPREPAKHFQRTSRPAPAPPARVPRALERLAAVGLEAGTDDSRLGDLAEQYARNRRAAQARLGGDAAAKVLAHLVADARYVVAAANVAMCARWLDPGLPASLPVAAKLASPIPLEGTMALARVDAAPRRWTQRALLVTAAAFLAAGAVELRDAWRRAETLIVGVQQEKADAAAAQIDRLIGSVQDRMAWSMDKAGATPEQRRIDSLRLLRQVPQLAELVHLDADGKELLRVSRFARDTIGSGVDFAGDARYLEARKRRTYVGAVYFRNASEPHVSLALARDGGNAGVTLAELNLGGVTDVVRSVRSGETGYAFVVDGTGRLVAGPDASSARSRLDASQLPAQDSGSVRTGLTGVPVLWAQAAVPTSGWRVVVELPVVEARQPLWNALLRGAGVLALGLAAVLLAFAAARRTGVAAGVGG